MQCFKFSCLLVCNVIRGFDNVPDYSVFQKRFEGTKVTVETFLAWKTKFDAEMAEMKKEKVHKEKTKGLTGNIHSS